MKVKTKSITLNYDELELITTALSIEFYLKKFQTLIDVSTPSIKNLNNLLEKLTTYKLLLQRKPNVY